MKIIENILTQNNCFKQNKQIGVKGIMIHSVGCPQPSADVFLRNWNVPKPHGGDVCVHGFIDGNTGAVYQTLPWTMRGWHCGKGKNGSANDTHIGIEMCEPQTIKYAVGSSYIDSDRDKTRAVVNRTYKSAVELFANLCIGLNLDPQKDGVILSHKEGAIRGIASGHSDPEHLWDKFDLNMTQFRKDIKLTMIGLTPTDTAPAEWAKDAWEWAKKYKICDGSRPSENITRQEVVTMMYRMFNLKI